MLSIKLETYILKHLEEKNAKLEGEGEVICHLCMEKLPFLRKYIGKDLSTTTGDCKIAGIADVETVKVETIFWPAGWRKSLCRCQSCTELYEKHEVSFLPDEADSIAVYENKNKERASQIRHEREMRALSSLDHVQKVEVIQGKLKFCVPVAIL